MVSKKQFPTSPGVYLFVTKEHQILYIGKAKSLADRIASYFSNKDDQKVVDLLAQADDIQFIITKNETEALLLEAELIGKHQPPFNRLLKDGNPFVYICFTKAERPTMFMERIPSKKDVCFGPFLNKNHARSVYSYLEKTFQLQTCNKKIASGCLAYHIGLCAGTCKADFDESYYQTRIALAQAVLNSDYKQAVHELDTQINQATKSLHFERAQHLHTYKENLEFIIQTLQTIKNSKVIQVRKKLESTKESKLSLLLELKHDLALKKIPYTIDCFDISHMAGNAIVGSCIRFLDGHPDPKNFRHFNIKTLDDQNDYAALAEIVTRRYKNKQNLPDLIVIDGGKGQLSATQNLVGATEIVGLAKREETIFFSDDRPFIILDQSKESHRLLLQIRDYAHHFAITHHRKKRSILE